MRRRNPTVARLPSRCTNANQTALDRPGALDISKGRGHPPHDPGGDKPGLMDECARQGGVLLRRVRAVRGEHTPFSVKTIGIELERQGALDEDCQKWKSQLGKDWERTSAVSNTLSSHGRTKSCSASSFVMGTDGWAIACAGRDAGARENAAKQMTRRAGGIRGQTGRWACVSSAITSSWTRGARGGGRAASSARWPSGPKGLCDAGAPFFPHNTTAVGDRSGQGHRTGAP